MLKSLRSFFNKKPKKTNVISKTNDELHKKIEILNSHELLPGTPYSRYLMPLEYKPSQDFKPRYGYSRPVIKDINTFFLQYTQNYIDVIQGIRNLSIYLEKIPRDFLHENLPNPGWDGTSLNPLDSAVLYYFIQSKHPKRYIEIGSGISTCFVKKALEDHNLKTHITCIDPTPRCEIRNVAHEWILQPLETIDLSIFNTLEENDIIFLDGSHRSFMNSDVTVFMLEILPNLKPGVIIHIHDIALPYDYPEFLANWYWNEQYLLAVYLMSNFKKIIPLYPANFVAMENSLKQLFDKPLFNLGSDYNYNKLKVGGSFWFTHKT